MLLELEIRDFALIDHIRVSFTRGFNVLTGETGAGKSILIDALNAVLGGKVGVSVIRPGAERALIEGCFEPSAEITAWLKHNQLEESDGESLMLSREINKSGSRMRINGTLVNMATVQDLRQKLLTIHAQHEARTLMSPQAQLDLLDGLGDESHRKLISRARSVYAKRKEIASQLNELALSEGERQRRLDFAQFQLSELVEADLGDVDEDTNISAHIKKLSNVVELETSLSLCQQLLSDGDGEGVPGLVDLLQRAIVELSAAAELDDSLSSICESLNGCLDTIEQDQRSLRRYRDALDTDPETLSNLEARMTVLAAVKRKYGPTLADALARQTDLESEIDRLQNSGQQSETLREEHAKLIDESLKIAGDLSAKRKTLATKLAKNIQTELSDLGMERCKFEISFTKLESAEKVETADKTDIDQSTDDNAVTTTAGPVANVGPTGFDRVEFLISPNPGQPLLPLSKIASGGELSRVMLVIKSIFAEADNVSTVIFDEIDTGLSGRVLQSMRDKLAKLARSHQILCITHQPIIASVADNYIEVRKQQTAQATSISVAALEEQQRVQSLASMASGQTTEEALKFAQALYSDSQKIRFN
jgi:DNA repair protein RecN (Recombination protein N)